jgi:hypothetical protein
LIVLHGTIALVVIAAGIVIWIVELTVKGRRLGKRAAQNRRVRADRPLPPPSAQPPKPSQPPQPPTDPDQPPFRPYGM